jgi:hypothetical protein
MHTYYGFPLFMPPLIETDFLKLLILFAVYVRLFVFVKRRFTDILDPPGPGPEEKFGNPDTRIDRLDTGHV